MIRCRVIVTFHTIASHDPDGDSLFYKWSLYPEAGTYEGQVSISEATKPVVTVFVPQEAQDKQLCVILEVTVQNESAPCTAYRRIVIDAISGKSQDLF